MGERGEDLSRIREMLTFRMEPRARDAASSSAQFAASSPLSAIIDGLLSRARTLGDNRGAFPRESSPPANLGPPTKIRSTKTEIRGNESWTWPGTHFGLQPRVVVVVVVAGLCTRDEPPGWRGLSRCTQLLATLPELAHPQQMCQRPLRSRSEIYVRTPRIVDWRDAKTLDGIREIH